MFAPRDPSDDRRSPSPLAFVVLPGTMPTAEQLLQAASNVETLRTLIGRVKTDMDVKNADEMTALHLAIEAQDDRCVRTLLEHGADVEAADPHDRRPLFIAVRQRQLEAVRAILKEGALTDAMSQGHTPIHEAAIQGDVDIMQLLLSHGADVNVLSWDDKQPLFYAVDFGNVEVVKVLLSHEADPDFFSSYAAEKDEPPTCLHLAATKDDVEIMAALLDGGAKPDLRDSAGATPILRSVEARSLDGVKLLRRYGASLDVVSFNNKTVANIAEGNKEMTELLKADPVVKGPRIRDRVPSDGAQSIFNVLKPPEPPAKHDRNKLVACHGFEATVTCFFINGEYENFVQKSASVYKLLHSHGPEALKSKFEDRKPTFTWYHLPANNMTWAEGLVRRLMTEKGDVSVATYEQIADDMELSTKEAVSGMKSQSKQAKALPTGITSLESRRPLCRTVPNHSSADQNEESLNFLAFVPFLHYETSEGQREFAGSLESAHKRAPARNQVKGSRALFQPRRSVEAPVVRENQSVGARSLNPCPPPRPPPSDSEKGQATTTLGSRLKGTIKLVGGRGARGSARASEAEADIERQDGLSLDANRANNVHGEHEASNMPAPEAAPVHHEEDLNRPSAPFDAVSTHRRSRERHKSRRHRHQARDMSPPTRNLHDYLIKGYFHAGGHGLQPRRTLDQYAYAGIVTTDRDKDQVVYRYIEKTKSLGEPKIFMTDQLWMWILGDDTMITCCPLRWNPWDEEPISRAPQTSNAKPAQSGVIGRLINYAGGNQESGKASKRVNEWVDTTEASRWPKIDTSDSLNVTHVITNHLRKPNREAIMSIYELAGLITSTCIEIFDPHHVRKEFRFFDFFDHSIRLAVLMLNLQSDKVAGYLRNFKYAVNVRIHDDEGEGDGNLGISDEKLSISNEIELMIEVDDILDELHTLKLVLTDQKNVVQDMNKALKKLAKDRTTRSYVNMRTLDDHLARIDQMEDTAKKADKSLHRLVDLKQKQASLAEASFAQEAARETARQSKTIMVFTVITILFLPVSFIAAIFAIDTNGFPREEDDKIPFDYLMGYILSIGFAISIPLIIAAFNVDRIAEGFNKFRSMLTVKWNPFVIAVVGLGLIAAVLAPTMVSSLTSSIKVAVAVVLVLLLTIGGISHLVYNLVSQARRSMSVTSSSTSSGGTVY